MSRFLNKQDHWSFDFWKFPKGLYVLNANNIMLTLEPLSILLNLIVIKTIFCRIPKYQKKFFLERIYSICWIWSQEINVHVCRWMDIIVGGRIYVNTKYLQRAFVNRRAIKECRQEPVTELIIVICNAGFNLQFMFFDLKIKLFLRPTFWYIY